MANQTEHFEKYTRGHHPNSLKNLEKCVRSKSWKPGESGNPKGLSLKRHVSDALRGPLKNIDPKKAKAIELLALSIVRDAIKGSKEDRKEIWERLEGKVTQPIEAELSGETKQEVKLLFTPDNLAEAFKILAEQGIFYADPDKSSTD